MDEIYNNVAAMWQSLAAQADTSDAVRRRERAAEHYRNAAGWLAEDCDEAYRQGYMLGYEDGRNDYACSH